jgi:hypothetical protein
MRRALGVDRGDLLARGCLKDRPAASPFRCAVVEAAALPRPGGWTGPERRRRTP